MAIATWPVPGRAQVPGRARVTPPWTRQRTGFVVLIAVWLAVFVVSWRGIDMTFLTLFTGVGHIVHFLAQNVPPQFVDLGHAVNEAVITLGIAVLGTVLAFVIAVPVGFMAARNTTVHPAVRWVARSIIVACRSVPDLIFAIIFVEAIGVGVLPGILALGLHSVGMLGKLYAESIEQTPPGPPEAVKSTGATRWQQVTTGVVPQVLPSFSSVLLYRLDINLRSSAILGYVGAGGIGFLLNEYMGELQFRAAMGILVIMFVLIVSMEIVAAVIRRALIGMEAIPVTGGTGSPGPPGSPGRASNPLWLRWASRPRLADRLVARVLPPKPTPPGARFNRETVRPPWTRVRRQRFSFLAGAVVVVLAAFAVTNTTPWAVFTSLPAIWQTVVLYFPPNFQTEGGALANGALESLAVAVIATTAGYLFAVPIGLLAARNVSRPSVARATRLFLVVLRSVPELILAIVFIVAVGLGLVAGTMALTVGSIGFVAKLVADSLEEVPPMPREAVLSVGATKAQETATSVITPTTPMLVGNGLYVLDINFRSSTILGIVGGGGIGFLLQQSMSVLAYRTTGAIIIVTFAVVLMIELIANWARKHLI
jgi:phosphonate transport system permease protein